MFNLLIHDSRILAHPQLFTYIMVSFKKYIINGLSFIYYSKLYSVLTKFVGLFLVFLFGHFPK